MLRVVTPILTVLLVAATACSSTELSQAAIGATPTASPTPSVPTPTNSPEVAEATPAESRRVAMVIGGGSSFGMCMGFCKTQVAIDESFVRLTLSTWGGEEPAHTIGGSLTETGRARLEQAAAAIDPAALEGSYGCPDCADGGAANVVISVGGSSQQTSTYDYASPPSQLADADAVLRQIIATLGACGSDDLVVSAEGCEPLPATPTVGDITDDALSESGGLEGDLLAPQAPPLFTLYVSNQSFDEPSVHLAVTIDGQVVADQNFDVEDEHNWITFEVDLPAGNHTLTATSDTGVDTSADFTTDVDQPYWAVLDYWFYSSEDGRYLSFDLYDEEIAFA